MSYLARVWDVISAISPLAAVSGGAVVALYIHWRRRKDNRAETVKSKADAHKELWYALRQMESQSKRGKSGRIKPHEMENPYDINWLRDHFRKNASLFSTELHDEYHALLEEDIRAVFDDGWKIDANFSPLGNGHKVRGSLSKRTLMLVDLCTVIPDVLTEPRDPAVARAESQYSDKLLLAWQFSCTTASPEGLRHAASESWPAARLPAPMR